jgi:D-glycero-D-manno-heptose 1,7-bisphosphate phosphatase
MEELLGLPRPVFDGICIAPEAPGQPSLYRKPSPRFILRRRWPARARPGGCWMVGDSAADIGAALAAGIRAAAVRTGKVRPDVDRRGRVGPRCPFSDFGSFAATLG